MLSMCNQHVCLGIATSRDVEVVPTDCDEAVSPVGLALAHQLTEEPAQPCSLQRPRVQDPLARERGRVEQGVEMFEYCDLDALPTLTLESLPEEEEEEEDEIIAESAPSKPPRRTDRLCESSSGNKARREAEDLYPRIGLRPSDAQPPLPGRSTPAAVKCRAVADEEEDLVVPPPAPTSARSAEHEKELSARQADLRKASSRLSMGSFRSPRPAAEPAPMHLRPALKSRVIIDRGEAMAKLGLDTTELVTKEEGALKIEEVEADGLMEQWNKAHSNREVMKGDYIVEVNGVKGTPQDLLKVLVHERRIDMLIKRVVQPSRAQSPGEGMPRHSLLRRWSSRVSTNSTSSRATTASGLSSRSSLHADDASTVASSA